MSERGHEFVCEECFVHVWQAFKFNDERLCAMCIFYPGWFHDEQLRRTKHISDKEYAEILKKHRERGD